MHAITENGLKKYSFIEFAHKYWQAPGLKNISLPEINKESEYAFQLKNKDAKFKKYIINVRSFFSEQIKEPVVILGMIREKNYNDA
jgi:hypothetical protein